MPHRRYETFLFDLDGTLIDTIELILTSYRHTIQAHRGSVPSDEAWLQGLGTPLWAQFRAWTDDEAEIEAMVATYRAHNLTHHDRLVREYPGVREAVTMLKARGRRLGVVTSKMRRGALRGLSCCGYDGTFETLVCADDVERHKPDPEPVYRALAALDADPERAVFIGDSPHDMASGRAAGVATAAVLWGPFAREALETHEPDHWLEAPGEILNLDGHGDGETA